MIDDDVKVSSVQIFKYFHNSISDLSAKFFQETGRKTYVTPTSYLELIGSFQRLITKKQEQTMRAKMRYVFFKITTLLAESKVVAMLSKMNIRF